MKKITLTAAQARKIILYAAGLSRHGQFGKGKEAVYKAIDHLGFVQVDTNYVVERAHHHSLAARVPGYKKEWLEQLQADGRIFEFWTFASGFMPVGDFRFSFPVKQGFLQRRNPLTPAESNMMRTVLDRIGREGPLMARDFEYDRETKSTGWWDWRPSKVALERLHLEGKLMTLRRKDFQKVYDLTENILRSDIDMTPPTAEEFARHMITRTLKALGVAYLKEIAFSAKYTKNLIRTEIHKMVEEGLVLLVEIEGLKTSPLYLLPEYKNKKITLSNEAFILSPFDILNVYRHRLRDFFDFDYQVECFVPAPKRKYGYFSLPILIGDTFVARMDSKADRKQRVLTVNNLHFEPIKLSQPMIGKIANAIDQFVRFNQCDTVVFKKCNDKKVLKSLQEKLP
jgi:uncharacterized protein YcaQ